jgi:hypothetical protein
LIWIKDNRRHHADIPNERAAACGATPHSYGRFEEGELSMVLVQTAPTIGRLQDEIQGVRYREATTTFCRLVSEGNQPLKAMIKEAIAAAASYVQVPSHMMRLPTGEMRGVNYDHTILGWRGAISLMGENGGTRGILPNIQAMCYVPHGLNVWDQLIC